MNIMEKQEVARLGHLLVTVFLSEFASFTATPVLPDITMEAICPAQDQCARAIFLSGFQQAVTGVGLVVMMPLIGNLSDVYGRKALLTLPMILSIIPFAILAFGRTTYFYYTYYVLRTITGMVSDGGIQCMALAYVADNTSEGKRASAIGILAGVGSAAFVCGTLAARFISTSHIFLVATVLAIVAAVYMRIFLKDTTTTTFKTEEATDENVPLLDSYRQDKTTDEVFKNAPSPKDIICFLNNTSLTFSLVASIAFLNSLAEGGEQAPFQYYLKARFHFNKDNFADIMLINNVGSTISQLLLMPTVAPFVGEEILLCIGLIAGFCNMFVNSIAWSIWVPYVASLFPILISFVKPAIQSIVSKQVGRNEQGTAQGCLSGLSSFGNIISPLIYSPLTALFLSDAAPLPYQGFSILCVGIAWLIAFIPGVVIIIMSRSKATIEGPRSPVAPP
ncbi:PREDICTED: hippocampus abundant transcript 1 protein-like [Ipomoea nil]|uniref:hippocampus abundant transcript 1 protein-like n=1 Tax=Ipomoea nil TaxID=35883 RepID=UPI0009014C97|nr:PREDICTED: hippocampus abundant transcript 1 protein-like [Ipomoea nil]